MKKFLCSILLSILTITSLQINSIQKVEAIFTPSVNSISREHCREVVNSFLNEGNWTARYGSTLVPQRCKEVYYNANWQESNPPNLQKCNFIRTLWRNGNWTARYGSTDQAAQCVSRYFPNGLGQSNNRARIKIRATNRLHRDYCRLVRDEFQRGNWTARYGSTLVPQRCKEVYYNANWQESNPPNLQKCNFIRTLWRNGNWTARYGSTDQAAQCVSRYFPNGLGQSSGTQENLYINEVNYFLSSGSQRNVLGTTICNSGRDFNPLQEGRIRVKFILNNRSYTQYSTTYFRRGGCVSIRKPIQPTISGTYPLTVEVYSRNGRLYDRETRDVIVRDYYDEEADQSESAEEAEDNYEREITDPDANPFSDTNLNTLEGKAAKYLNDKGIIGGFPDGTFRGGAKVNRAEAAKFLILAKYGSVENLQNNGRFSDVVEGKWYVRYVIGAANRSILSGYSDGTFRPAQTVNTAEFLKILVNTFDLPTNLSHNFIDVPNNIWYERYVGVVPRYHLMPSRTNRILPAKQLTRGEVAIAIYKTLIQN